MKTWVWKSWGGRKRTVQAQDVDFRPQHVLFRDEFGKLLLAIKNEDITDLHPEDQGDPEWWS